MAPLIEIQKPSMDADLRAALNSVSFPILSKITPDVVELMRKATATPPSYVEEQRARGISHREVQIPSKDDEGHEIILSILECASSTVRQRPCIYWMHGGGFHWGDRLHTLEYATDLILECDAVCVSVEYRLAPEKSFFAAVEDCFMGLRWTSEHAQELRIDPKRLMVGGVSAGGGLAASTVLLCRDRQGPLVCAQLLICPALNNNTTTVSSQQYMDPSDFLPGEVITDLKKSSMEHTEALENGDITIPGKAKDLSGLPTTYLDVGSAEVLRDETVAYGSSLWAHGVQAELHVWAGGFHGFDIFVPDAVVSQASRKAKLIWAKRVFGS